MRPALLLLTLLALAACSRPQPPAPPAPAVYVSPVHHTEGQRMRSFSGTWRPRIESDLAFRVGGKVSARLVELGQAVRAGQPLARLDAADVQLGLEAATDQWRAAEVDAVQAASDAARFKRLVADGSVGAADQERQQARADAAAARLAQAARQLGLARNRAAYAVLPAPFDGVVTALRVEAGQLVAEGQPLITLARPSEMELVVDIPESLAPQLRRWEASAAAPGAAEGQPALPLRLRELSPTAASATRTFRARFAVVGLPKDTVLPMGATAELRLSQAAGVPSAELPVSALLSTQQQPAVWLADEPTGRLTRQPVQLVSQTSSSVRVAGLNEGALVVTVGAQKLDGQSKVRVLRRPLEALARADATVQP